MSTELLRQIERLKRPLLSFIETVEATGGVDLKLRPNGDPTWQDLGEAYAEACAALDVPMKQTNDTWEIRK